MTEIRSLNSSTDRAGSDNQGVDVVLPTFSVTRAVFKWGHKGAQWQAFLEIQRMTPHKERVLVLASPRKGQLARGIRTSI